MAHNSTGVPRQPDSPLSGPRRHLLTAKAGKPPYLSVSAARFTRTLLSLARSHHRIEWPEPAHLSHRATVERARTVALKLPFA